MSAGEHVLPDADDERTDRYLLMKRREREVCCERWEVQGGAEVGVWTQRHFSRLCGKGVEAKEKSRVSCEVGRAKWILPVGQR